MTTSRETLTPTEASVKAPRRWSQGRDTSRAAAADATRARLIEVGRALFASEGFHGVGVRELTASAEVSRGALAHHFGNKDGLFLAVFDQIEQELIAHSRRSADPALDAWSQLHKGIQHYLDAALRPDVQRITLIDAPAVLGWQKWRELEEGYSLGGLIQTLQAAMDAGLIRVRPVAPLAHLILGSIMEAAMLIAHSDAPDARRAEVGEALEDLLRGLE